MSPVFVVISLFSFLLVYFLSFSVFLLFNHLLKVYLKVLDLLMHSFYLVLYYFFLIFLIPLDEYLVHFYIILGRRYLRL